EARQLIVATIAIEMVRCGIADDDIVAGAADHILDVGKGIDTNIGITEGLAGREVDNDAFIGTGIYNGVIVGAAIDDIVTPAMARDDGIVAAIAEDLIVIRAANQKIVAGTPNNERRSAGFRSIKDVVARAAGEEDIGRPIRGYRQAAAWIEVIQCNRSEEHTSELQSRENLVCRLLLEKKNKKK